MKQLIKAHIFALITVTIWGVTFINSRVLLNAGLSAYEILLSRFILAWFFLTMFRPRGIPFRGMKQEIPFIIAGIFGTTIYFLFENNALKYTKIANVNVIVEIAPMVTALLFWLVFKQKLKPQFFLGSALVLVGLVLVSTNGDLGQIQGSLYGDMLAALGALSWVVYTLMMPRIRKQEALRTQDSEIDAIIITKRIFFWGIVSALCIMPLMHADFSWLFKPNPTIYLNLLYLSLCGSALSYVIWNSAMGTLGEVKVNYYLYLMPVVSAFTSFVVFKENLSLAAILGIIVLTLGLLISSYSSKKKAHVSAAEI
ncbi:MAG: DMT family transporter [Coriobacteriia bacterium]|nr:DMT family transporter [Coriobacteriia bacterium]